MKKITIILATFILLMILSACSEKNTNPLVLPDSEEVESIVVKSCELTSEYTSELLFEKTDADWISEFITQAGEYTATGRNSEMEHPLASKFIVINFNLKNGTNNRLFAYQEKNKWYIEQAYQGIYFTSDDFVKTLTDKAE